MSGRPSNRLSPLGTLEGGGTALDQAAADVLANWPTDANARATSANWLLAAVRDAGDPSAFERIVEMLAERQDVSSYLGVSLVDAMLARAVPAKDPAAAYVAAAALEDATTRLLVHDMDGRRLDLVTRLRDGASNETDATWAQAVARISGLLYAHWPDDSLRSTLRAAVRRLRHHPDVSGDAEMEDAHIALLDALDAVAPDALEDAEQRFSAIAAGDEERVDAAFFASVVRAVRTFGLGGSRSVLLEAVGRARDVGAERALYGRQAALPAFSRRGAEAMWGRLVDTLANLAEEIDEPVWIHGARTVSLMAEAIQASRCVAVAPGHAGDATEIVVPRIEARLGRSTEQRRILEQALARDAIAPGLRSEAAELLRSVSRVPKPEGPDDALANVIGADNARRIAAQIGEDALQQLRDQLASVPSRARDRDSQWHATYRALLEGLEGHPDFDGSHRKHLEAVIADLLDFCSFCMRAQLNFADGAFAYLGDPDAKEAAMADHLVMYLQQAGWWAQPEVPHEGSGGRVDVRVNLGPADRFIVECKRDRAPVAAGTVDPYLAQTERYLTTSLRIAALAVLDLTDKNTGPARGLDTSAWISQVGPADPAGPVRKIVTVVIPGNRASTPSQVGRATRG